MKFEAINKVYTQRVAEWMAKGYWINAGSMGGSQGEYAHVDLTNGSEIIRILMQDGGEWVEHEKFDSVDVIVGRVPASEKVRIGVTDRLGNTIWNQKLETITKDSFFRLGRRWDNPWYGTLDEAKAAMALRHQRWQMRKDHDHKDKVFENGARVVLEFVRKQRGFKSAKLSDITSVKKVYHTSWTDDKITEVSYEVVAKGKRLVLKVKEA